MSPRVLLILIICAAFFAHSITRGGNPERLFSVSVTIWAAVDVGYHYFFGAPNFERLVVAHAIFDMALFLVILYIAIRANRMWPCWAAAAALIVMLGHLAAALEMAGMQRAYWAMTQMPFLIQLLALVLGTNLHIRRTRLVGPYNSWRSDWQPINSRSPDEIRIK